jgi:hypothetical protein
LSDGFIGGDGYDDVTTGCCCGIVVSVDDTRFFGINSVDVDSCASSISYEVVEVDVGRDVVVIGFLSTNPRGCPSRRDQVATSPLSGGGTRCCSSSRDGSGLAEREGNDDASVGSCSGRIVYSSYKRCGCIDVGDRKSCTACIS